MEYNCENDGYLPIHERYFHLVCKCPGIGTFTYMGPNADNPTYIDQTPLSQCINGFRCCGFKSVEVEKVEENNIFTSQLSLIISVVSLVISLIIVFVCITNYCVKRNEDRTIKTIMQRAQVQRNVATLNNLSNV